MNGSDKLREEILEFSERLVAFQKPLRILNSIKIPAELFTEFKKNQLKGIFPFNPDFYAANDVKFDLARKKLELQDIANFVANAKAIGESLKAIFTQVVRSYGLALEMVEARGTKQFGVLSREAYGDPNSKISGSFKSLYDFCIELQRTLAEISTGIPSSLDDEKMTSAELTRELFKKLTPYFGGEIKVVLSDGIISDAAAGGDQIKIRQEAKFSQSDLSVFEVHEGWVHVGTTLNGRNQTHGKWLSVGPPRSAATQEGLAVLMEIVSFRSTVNRMRKINHRLEAIKLAFDGANFFEIYQFHVDRGLTEMDAFKNTVRVFRGTTGEGGSAFAKDISYFRGFIENFNFLRVCHHTKKLGMVPLMFAGKIVLEDLPTINELQEDGILQPPKFVPSMFTYPEGLEIWLAYSEFLNVVRVEALEKHFQKILN